MSIFTKILIKHFITFHYNKTFNVFFKYHIEVLDLKKFVYITDLKSTHFVNVIFIDFKIIKFY